MKLSQYREKDRRKIVFTMIVIVVVIAVCAVIGLAKINSTLRERAEVRKQQEKIEEEQEAAGIRQSQQEVENVQNLIGSIGEVTLEKEDVIRSAREEYDSLSDDQKAQVFNIDILYDAETAIGAMNDLVEAYGIEYEPEYSWHFYNSDGYIRESIQHTVSDRIGDTKVVDVDTGTGIPQAVYLDGDNDYIECGKKINLDKNYTLHFVFNCEETNKDYSGIFTKYSLKDKGAFAFSIRQGHFNCRYSTEEGHTEMETEQTLKDDQWYDVCVVNDDNDIRIYINGKQDEEGKIGQAVQNNDKVVIGRQTYMYEPREQLQFKGYIAMIDIFDLPMSESQVQKVNVLK